MDITLIANGLTHRGEHGYRLIQEVRGALARRTIGCHVYVSRSLDAGIIEESDAIPHFKYSLYDSVGPRLPAFLVDPTEGRWKHRGRALSYPAELLTWSILNRSFRQDLEALPPDHRAADRLLVITAVCQNQLSGVIEFMRAQAWSTLPCVVCHLMFLPNWTPWEYPAQLGDAYYRNAFQKASPFLGRKLFFTTENDSIAEIYREKYGIKTKILPVPLAVSRSPCREGKTVCLGFFGYSKTSKGFHLLPEAITLCQNAGLNVEFHIQVQHSQWEKAAIKAERKLRSLPNVHLIDGALPSDNYITETNKVDVVLLPYDPILFGARGSGIFTESVSAGRPIIASDGTRAAESIRIGEAQGEIFAPYNAEELANAIKRLLPRISQLRTSAATRADGFAIKHSGEAYVDVLLSLMKAGAPSAFAAGQQIRNMSPEGHAANAGVKGEGYPSLPSA